jgi:DNA-binding NtrC family response regulator
MPDWQRDCGRGSWAVTSLQVLRSRWQRLRGLLKVARKIRVLVVENYAPLRAALAQILFSWGYEAETASDGLEALGKIDSFDPEVIVSGLQMPHLGGIELLKALPHRFPCIILSADAGAKEAIEAIQLGAFSFLEKPVEPERLHLGLRNCLGHSSTLGSGVPSRWPAERGVSPIPKVAQMPSKGK